MRFVIGFLLCLASCIDSEATEPLPTAGQLEAFIEQAQPVLETRCANPSCHGNANRPLSLFAVYRYRQDSADVYLDAPLTDEELQHNFLQASVFVVGVQDATQCQLLTKPLAVEAGGIQHADVDVFPNTSDYDYRQLKAWVEDALKEDSNP